MESATEVGPVKSTARLILHSTRYSLTTGAWIAAQMSTIWWTVALWKLSEARPAVQTMSVVIDDYAGIGIATVWLIITSFAEFAMFMALILYSGGLGGDLKRGAEPSWYESVLFSVIINGCVFLSVAGISVSYAWTIATLPALGPVMNKHSLYLASVSLQHVAFFSTIIFSATCVSWVHGNQMQAQRMIHDAFVRKDEAGGEVKQANAYRTITNRFRLD